MGTTMGITMGVTSLAGGIAQAGAQKAQGTMQKALYDSNVKLDNLKAEDAARRGDISAAQAGLQTKGVVGAQRAAYAAQGIDVNSGSALNTQEGTEAVGAQNVANIKNNAWREAFGFQTQAINDKFQGNMAEMAGDNASANTLLTSGLSGLSQGLNGYAAWNNKLAKPDVKSQYNADNFGGKTNYSNWTSSEATA